MCDVKPGLTKSVFASVSGWTRTTGWTTGSSSGSLSPSHCPSPTWSRTFLNCARPSWTACSVDRNSCERGAQRLERGLLVAERGVAAGVGDDDGPEHRPGRRALDERDVGVPVDAATPRRDVAVRAVQLARLRVVDLEDVREAVDAGDDRVPLGELAEALAERLVGALVEVLAGEEDDFAVEPDPADRCDRRVVDVAEVDAADLGADRRGERADVEVGSRQGAGHVRYSCRGWTGGASDESATPSSESSAIAAPRTRRRRSAAAARRAPARRATAVRR